ncbi:alpha/beta hydrolase family protein [Myxococcus fulvus]|uniref:alpha/beta hydrolase family protein n=1 Tax=Myxococcus fulvus TaxID=33 RepID=UPI00200A96C7|nr:prolyl oligopeptidase family serine peptidase [Myxococcus fulvus]MCK8497660.1 prolyl oligopeptidase family serine peptidase [Myxococcus fulvus]
MRTTRWVILVLALMGCSSSDLEPEAPLPPEEQETDSKPLTVTVLGSGQAAAGGQQWAYQLLRLQEEGKAAAYAQWFPPRSPGAWPVMMLTRPYDGITWTGEAVDAKWAARGNGFHPDDSEPGHHAGSSNIVYTISTPELIAGESFFYLYNGLGVLNVFGRFYAGGSIQNDRDDMHAGLRFLEQAPEVDRSRIGIQGGSWGGFEALYAAADAPEAVRPRAGVALFPLSDFARQFEYLETVIPSRVSDPWVRSQYATFFEPYRRRIVAATGGAPGAPGADYSAWTREHLAPRLTTPFLVLHEDWDTLVPVEQTQTLAPLVGPTMSPLYLQHLEVPDWNTRALDHGQLVVQYGHALTTVSLGYLLTNLGPEEQSLYVPFVQDALVGWLQAQRVLQLSGRDVSQVAPRLFELADPRVTLVEMTSGSVYSGSEGVAVLVNALWGTQYTAGEIREVLSTGLPP